MSFMFMYIASVIILQWLVYTIGEFTTLLRDFPIKPLLLISFIPLINGLVILGLIGFLLVKRIIKIRNMFRGIPNEKV